MAGWALLSSPYYSWPIVLRLGVEAVKATRLDSLVDISDRADFKKCEPFCKSKDSDWIVNLRNKN